MVTSPEKALYHQAVDFLSSRVKAPLHVHCPFPRMNFPPNLQVWELYRIISLKLSPLNWSPYFLPLRFRALGWDISFPDYVPIPCSTRQVFISNFPSFCLTPWGHTQIKLPNVYHSFSCQIVFYLYINLIAIHWAPQCSMHFSRYWRYRDKQSP